MKKVLIIAENFSFDNGFGRYAQEITRRLAKHYQVYILTSNPGKTDWQKLNIPVYFLPSMGKLKNPLINLWYSLRYIHLAGQVDFIHYCSDFPYCVLFSLIPLFKTPRFITAHGTYSVAPLDHHFHRYFLVRGFEKAKKVICVSNFTRQEILRRVKINNTVVINNGVDFEKFAKAVADLSAEKSRIILSVGALKDRKGFDISLKAVAAIKAEFFDLKYYIIGDQSDNSYFSFLKQLVLENNLDANVIFEQRLPDEELIKLYHRASVFLLTPVVVKQNRFEGFGLVYLEAGACGKPVIGTTGCGAEDAIKDGYNGLLVPPNNVPAVAMALKKILADPDFARTLGQNGRQLAAESDWDKVFLKYQAIYESFID
jgi:phosphatidylinositol alpha-1,6-mannosyltransferase